MALTNLQNAQAFEEEIKSSPKVLVDFWATWCGPCKTLAPILEEVNEQMGDEIKILKVDVDLYPELAGNFNVMTIPTMVVFHDGKPVNSHSGVLSSEDIIKLIHRT